MRNGASHDNVKRTVYICDIASKVSPEPALCAVSCMHLPSDMRYTAAAVYN